MKPQPGTILAVQQLDLHGSIFYDLTFELDSSPGRARRSRLGAESVQPAPQPGQKALFGLLLDQVTSVVPQE